MKKIFIGQSSLRIELQCKVDITGALTKKIKYNKPEDDTEYEWTASVSHTLQGHIYYDIVNDTELDVVGKWKFWSWIEFSDGRVAAGEPQTIEVFKEGTL